MVHAHLDDLVRDLPPRQIPLDRKTFDRAVDSISPRHRVQSPKIHVEHVMWRDCALVVKED